MKTWGAGAVFLTFCVSLQAQESRGTTECEDIAFFEYYCNPLEIGGTFSNLRYDERLQKAVGMEVRIVNGECGDQASIQFGEGQGPESHWSRLMVVDITWTSALWPLHVAWPSLEPNEGTDDFWFSIPPGTGYAGEFYGVIYRDRLDGLFRPINGRDLRISLPRLNDAKSN